MTHVRFLHTSDWQIGMTRRKFLPDEAEARFEAARIDAVTRIGEIANETGCQFIVVAGDVLECNALTDTTRSRLIEALRTLPVPTYLLPGNHDPLDATHPWAQGTRLEHVHLIDSAPPRVVAPGVELVGAPLRALSAGTDRVADALAPLAPFGGIRIAVGHGQIEARSNTPRPDLIDQDNVEQAVQRRIIDYLALGDTHSTQNLSETGAVWYSGAPEVTAFHELPDDKGENNSGNVLVVDITVPDDATDAHPLTADVTVTPHPVGTWTFDAITRDIADASDLRAFIAELSNYPDKSRTVVKYALRGAVALSDYQRFINDMERLSPAFAACYPRQRTHDLRIQATADDIDRLDLPGWVRSSVTQLEADAAAGDAAARDALNLLFSMVSPGEDPGKNSRDYGETHHEATVIV